MSYRAKNLDGFITELAIDKCHERIAKIHEDLVNEKLVRKQTRYWMLTQELRLIAQYSYAFGHPIAEVRPPLIKAMEVWLNVFELRGTEKKDRQTRLEVIALPEGRKKHIWHDSDDDPGPAFSWTSSKNSLEAIYTALVARQDERAAELAKLVWDPPEGDYLTHEPTYSGGRPFEYTYDEHHLAYALRYLYEGDKVAARAELERRVLHIKDKDGFRSQAEMIAAIIDDANGPFLAALEEHLFWHEKKSRRQEAINYPYWFLSFPATALSVLAIEHGIIDMADLPQDNVFLPIALISTRDK